MAAPTNTTQPPAYTAVAGAGGSGGGGGEPPKKYVKINGVTKLNPEYTAWKAAQGEQATTCKNPDAALAVVSTMDDYFELNAENAATNNAEAELAEGTNMTLEIMQDSEVTSKVGLSSDAMVDGLAAIFQKHEAPIGLMNKLMGLTEYDGLEFIVDDSGSMGNWSDTTTPNGSRQTRWQEAEQRLNDMLELLAYVPTPTITIKFLNRGDSIVLNRSGETPERFLEHAYAQLTRTFLNPPRGSSPILNSITSSFQSGAGKRTSRYLMCDGCPNGGERAKQQIFDLVKNRTDPEGNPVTLMSCTNEDGEVEWMKELEEIAPFTAEYDDFNDEAAEVRYDQGDALPYTKGFHLVAQVVGAMNPHDLDAMDESIPFTKYTLDNLLGVVTTPEEYRHYFDEFRNAQGARNIHNGMDRVKAQMDWNRHYELFVSTPMANQIAAVADFKRDLERAAS